MVVALSASMDVMLTVPDWNATIYSSTYLYAETPTMKGMIYLLINVKNHEGIISIQEKFTGILTVEICMYT